MIEITSDAIERVGTLLADVPKGAERVFANAMNRGISRVKTQALKRTKQVYTVNNGALNNNADKQSQHGKPCGLCFVCRNKTAVISIQGDAHEIWNRKTGAGGS